MSDATGDAEDGERCGTAVDPRGDVEVFCDRDQAGLALGLYSLYGVYCCAGG